MAGQPWRPRFGLRNWGAAWLMLLLCSAPALTAQAEPAGFRVSVERWNFQEWQLDGVRLEWRGSANSSDVGLRVEVGQVSRDTERLGGLRWDCHIASAAATASPPAPAPNRCVGPLSWNGKRIGELEYRHSESPRLAWREGASRVQLALKEDAAELVWKRVSVSLLQPLLSEYWSSLQRLSGGSEGRFLWNWESERGSAEFAIDGLGLDAEAGSVALADVPLSGTLEVQGLGPQLSADLEVNLAGGEGLLGPLYTAFAAETRVSVSLAGGANSEWRLRAEDPDQHSLDLNITAGESEWRDWPWRITLHSDDLNSALARYLDSPLATMGWRDTQLSGKASLEAAGVGESLQQFELSLDQVNLLASQPALATEALYGRLHWQARDTGRDSQLEWQNLSTWGLDLGPGQMQLTTEQGAWRLQAPLNLALYGGKLSLYPLRLAPLSRETDFGLMLEGVSLGPLSQQFGWPALPGALSANLPAAHYKENRLTIDGDIQVRVFDGQVSLGNLSMERPFGVAPAFAADIELQNLDLGPLTSAFGFGEITGRLDGSVQGLRMLDWSPIAFDARLFSTPGYKGKKRISQRAVQDLSSVGGGIIAGLQQQVLKVFESFSYRQLALSCRLANDVCQMGGIESEGNGYTVVEGAGLPRITVKGFQRRVDWPVLLKRLRSAVERGVVIGDAGEG